MCCSVYFGPPQPARFAHVFRFYMFFCNIQRFVYVSQNEIAIYQSYMYF